MHHGRWYPTAITLANGDMFVASGVTKLLKPVYPSHPTDSGTNVTETETYDPHRGHVDAEPVQRQPLAAAVPPPAPSARRQGLLRRRRPVGLKPCGQAYD